MNISIEKILYFWNGFFEPYFNIDTYEICKSEKKVISGLDYNECFKDNSYEKRCERGEKGWIPMPEPSIEELAWSYARQKINERTFIEFRNVLKSKEPIAENNRLVEKYELYEEWSDFKDRYNNNGNVKSDGKGINLSDEEIAKTFANSIINEKPYYEFESVLYSEDPMHECHWLTEGYGLGDDFWEYRNSYYRKKAIEWCENNKINYTFEPFEGEE